MILKQKVAVVAGVGPGNGAALTRRFAAAGYTVAMVAKSRPMITAAQRASAKVCALTVLPVLPEVLQCPSLCMTFPFQSSH
jgi:NAD(P)-dependent dehydrogenase (short-subunit alcohol dehydrogenase family)